MHMTGAAVVSAVLGWRYGAICAAKGLKMRASERRLQHEWELIIESDAKHGLRKHEEDKAAQYFLEQMGRKGGI
jgi:hypothetical protein